MNSVLGLMSPAQAAEVAYSNFGYSPGPQEIQELLNIRDIRVFERSSPKAFPGEALDGYIRFGATSDQDVIAYNLGLNTPSQKYFLYALSWISLGERGMYSEGETVKLPADIPYVKSSFVEPHIFAQNLLMPEHFFIDDFLDTLNFTNSAHQTFNELAKAYDVFPRHVKRRALELDLIAA